MVPTHEPWHRPRTETSPYSDLTSRNFHYFLHRIHTVIRFTKKITFPQNKPRTKHNHHLTKDRHVKHTSLPVWSLYACWGNDSLWTSAEPRTYELPAQLTKSTGVHTEVKSDKNGHGTDWLFSLQFVVFEGICLEAIMTQFRVVGSILDPT